MYHGQNSWVAVLVLFGVMAFRIISSQRRRGARGPGVLDGGRGFADPRSGRDGSGSPGSQADGTSFTGTSAGWFTDPFVRHEQRYWSGTAWTEHVLDAGTPGTDPPPPPRTPG